MVFNMGGALAFIVVPIPQKLLSRIQPFARRCSFSLFDRHYFLFFPRSATVTSPLTMDWHAMRYEGGFFAPFFSSTAVRREVFSAFDDVAPAE